MSRFQRHVEEVIENRDEEDVERIKAVVQQAVEKTLLGKKFDGTISGAVEASIKVRAILLSTLSGHNCKERHQWHLNVAGLVTQEANKKINAILAQEELNEENEEPDEPAGIEQKSSSIAGAAAEGFKFIGSFFAQAAMGGAEVRLYLLSLHSTPQAALSLICTSCIFQCPSCSPFAA